MLAAPVSNSKCSCLPSAAVTVAKLSAAPTAQFSASAACALLLGSSPNAATMMPSRGSSAQQALVLAADAARGDQPPAVFTEEPAGNWQLANCQCEHACNAQVELADECVLEALHAARAAADAGQREALHLAVESLLWCPVGGFQGCGQSGARRRSPSAGGAKPVLARWGSSTAGVAAGEASHRSVAGSYRTLPTRRNACIRSLMAVSALWLGDAPDLCRATRSACSRTPRTFRMSPSREGQPASVCRMDASSDEKSAFKGDGILDAGTECYGPGHLGRKTASHACCRDGRMLAGYTSAVNRLATCTGAALLFRERPCMPIRPFPQPRWRER